MADRQSRSKWRVHESTTRALCRFAFVALGLLPLALCLVWSAQEFLPTYQRQQSSRWEQLLSSQIGAQLKIAAVESLAPQRYALHEVRLLHPETSVELGRARRADIERSGGKWIVKLTEPELEGADLATTWNSFHDWFLCRPRSAAHAAWVGMDQLTIHEASGPRILYDLTLNLLPGMDASVLSILFRPQPNNSFGGATDNSSAENEKPKLSELIVKRKHQTAGPTTQMQLRTGESQLACSLLLPLSPVVNRLGDQATFSGTIDLDIGRGAWRIRITNGLFGNVDMAQLTLDTEAAMSGQGWVQFENLIATHAGLEAARGAGIISTGKMTQALFHAFGKHLGVKLRETNQVSSYGFDDCKFSFELREPNLQLVCSMSDALGPLAERPEAHWPQSLPLENIIFALQSCTVASTTANQGSGQPSDQAASRLPATRLAKQALVWLPLGDEQSRAAQAQLRLSAIQSPDLK